jgi:hypothetical protein
LSATLSRWISPSNREKLKTQKACDIIHPSSLACSGDLLYIHSVNTLQKMIDYLNKYTINLVN